MFLRLGACVTCSHCHCVWTFFFSCPVCESAEGNVIFLIDGSPSVGFENFQSVRSFIHSITDNFNIGPIQVGVAQYNDDFFPEFTPKTHSKKESLQSAMEGISYRPGGTRQTAKALQRALQKFFIGEASKRLPQVAVIITGGDIAEDTKQLEAASQQLRENRVIVIGIAVGQANMEQLEALAKPQLLLFTTPNYQTLPDLTAGLLETMCDAMQEQSTGEAMFECWFLDFLPQKDKYVDTAKGSSSLYLFNRCRNVCLLQRPLCVMKCKWLFVSFQL